MIILIDFPLSLSNNLFNFTFQLLSLFFYQLELIQIILMKQPLLSSLTANIYSLILEYLFNFIVRTIQKHFQLGSFINRSRYCFQIYLLNIARHFQIHQLIVFKLNL